MNSLPLDWLVPAHPKRLILHWTAGAYRPSNADIEHYHFLITSDGTLVEGEHTVAANDSTVDADGYAAHTYRCNTGSIGLSVCCMKDAVESPFHPGTHPMTKPQWEQMTATTAQLIDHYGITLSPQTVLTHAEVQHNLGISQRGKWDISVYPSETGTLVKDTAHNVGERIRSQVMEYHEKPVREALFCDLPTLWPGRQQSPSLSVVVLSHKLGYADSDGTYSQDLVDRVKEEQRRLGLVPDGIVCAKTWAALLG